ncbi:XrtA system polysaccharide chain length determinant [Saccharophagus degradans]|uniref:Chain length-determining protein n=1 Tax=Saccharophagus degradans TaxID=86304 RepID=A0AAW7XAV6_9GAMM|nr:XrtA system polysaccharide chain length determinant [Saccharophagus degradans]MDO6424851.1 chain length-determining protein [Saccharophagus degradans]MDO6606639.1 chain length-determining protein [Saccharophagus degradans]
MDPQQLKDLAQAIWLELVHYKEWCVAIFIVVSLAAIGLGYTWPQSYKTSAVLNADEQNIIAPLLSGRAEVTKVDRSQDAKEVIYTRSFLEKVVKESGILEGDATPDAIERKIYGLRSTIEVSSVNKNYFRVSYTAPSPDRSFTVLSETVRQFVDHTAKQKKEESYSAYQFIDSQVQAYKRQLEDAEEKLKIFKSGNIDGSEASVSSRISQLRTEIENLKLSIDETNSRLKTVKSQLENESSYLQARSKLDSLEQRKSGLNTELENLRLSYQENYPDVVSLKLQIAELDKRIEEIYRLDGVTTSGSSSTEQNPLYEELRKQMAVAEVDLRTQKQRKASLERLLEQEYARAEKIAANEAELSELTRDYDVTKRVYEEMLDRKEKARMSMALDVEGQGVSYKIHEPPVYPLQSTGLKFIHFAIIGPILGFIIPIGLVIALIMLDPRIRSGLALASKFEDEVEVIGTIPHSSTALAKRVVRRDAVIIIGVTLCFLALYAVIVANKLFSSTL